MTGDPERLAEAYDRYGDSLYKYCRSLLGDPADAADALRDTFVIAATWTGGLGDPDRSRARLYAVARGECLAALRAGKPAAARDETAASAAPGDGTKAASGNGAASARDDAGAPDAPGAPGAAESSEVAGGVTPAGPRLLLEDACRGLDSAAREVIGLHLWHGLEAAEIATVLDVRRHRARRLLSRASDQLDACLGVLLAGRAEPIGCPKLASMLVGWDGNLTPALCWWAHGHIRKCAACTAGRAAQSRAVLPAGVSASAAMVAAAVESLRLAVAPPAALREHTLALATGEDPSAVAHRAVLLSRAGSAGRRGLRWALRERMATAGSRGMYKGSISRRLRTAAGALVALAVVVAAVVVGLTHSATPVKLADGTPPLPAPTASASSAPATSASPAATASHGGPSHGGPSHRGPSPARTRRPHKPSRHPTAPAPTGTASATPAGGTPSPSVSPPPAPTSSPTASPPVPSGAPSPPAATLTVTPPGGQLRVTLFGARIRLTAHGGPIAWSVTVSGGSGRVVIQPASGNLRAGQSVIVTIFASRHASGRQLTVSPVGTVFTIVTGRDHRFGAAGRSGARAGAIADRPRRHGHRS